MFITRGKRIEQKIDRALDLLQQIIDQGETIMSVLDPITAAVTNETTVDQSVLTLVQQLATQIKQNSADPAAVQALADQINANAKALAAAVAANTPAAPAQPAPAQPGGTPQPKA